MSVYKEQVLSLTSQLEKTKEKFKEEVMSLSTNTHMYSYCLSVSSVTAQS